MKLNQKQRDFLREQWRVIRVAQARGDDTIAFAHLERVHIVGQRNVLAHTRAHIAMLCIGMRRRDLREILGQLLRTAAALTKTLIWVPRGNTGGANISAFASMPIPCDLQHLVE